MFVIVDVDDVNEDEKVDVPPFAFPLICLNDFFFLQGLLKLLVENSEILHNYSNISEILIKAYEPAFGIIGDSAKRDPQTRQSADHSMVRILSILLFCISLFLYHSLYYQYDYCRFVSCYCHCC